MTSSDQIPRGFVVGVVQGVLREELSAGQLVGEEGVLAAVEHPEGLAVGPDATGVGVAFSECDVARGEPVSAGEVVREQPVLAAVGDPDGDAVREDAARGAVALVEGELALGGAPPALQVVGVGGVVGAGPVLGQPEGRAIGPRARGRLATVRLRQRITKGAGSR